MFLDRHLKANPCFGQVVMQIVFALATEILSSKVIRKVKFFVTTAVENQLS